MKAELEELSVLTYQYHENGDNSCIQLKSSLTKRERYHVGTKSKLIKQTYRYAAEVFKEYMVAYLKVRIVIYKKHYSESMPEDTIRLEKLLERIESDNGCPRGFLGIFAQRKWKGLILRSRPKKHPENRRLIRELVTVCERRGGKP